MKTKTLPEMTEKQLKAELLKRQREYARSGSVASIHYLEKVKAEVAARAAA